MAQPRLIPTERVIPKGDTSAMAGNIKFLPIKALWLGGHGFAGLMGIILFPSLGALAVFLGLTALTICAGHSVGMHRLLIHRSFQTYRWLEYILVWLGTLVGMNGPFGMIQAHDMRDWHQRQTTCPDHPAHNTEFWRDAYWQLTCEYRLQSPPTFVIEPQIKSDRFYRLLEATWMAQQLPLGILLFAFGGWAFVLWGISLRVFVSLVGHWMVGHFAHRTGSQTWFIQGLPVQGYNLPKIGFLTFGENWHGNHHAFPHSAKLGLGPDQLDLGYSLIACLARLGLVWGIRLPASEPERQGLTKTPNKTDIR